MGRYALRRLLQAIPVFIGTTFLIWFLVWGLPGDPFAGRCGERQCPASYVQSMTDKFGLDDPLPVQYLNYLTNLLRGEFGQTFNGTEIGDLLAQAFPVSIKLALVAVAAEALIGITAGVLTGLRRGSFFDNLVLVSTLVLIATPIFVIGLVARYSLGLASVSPEAPLVELIIPGLILGSGSLAYITRLTRVNLVENRRADYVRTAVAKGLAPGRVTGVHLLRNSMIPVVTWLGLDLGALMGGAIVTEGIFNIRGIGGLLFDSINRRQSGVVVSIVAILVLVYLIVNLLVDLLYGVLDPRIRYE
ncbi:MULTISPECIES: ABC transporter permease [Catellatospora]|uniref:ABC transporter permease n=1 Tax=Catellatospora chokoriensis TaxID=310353 RepID=A0A8J3NPT0_9ACTN|nr:ABC transporter permease [Catellatospora chokoriensis]GIF88482.1 ABC transporter permease [Catellatospora chokoriensis]